MDNKKNIVLLMTPEGPVIGEISAESEQAVIMTQPMLLGADQEGNLELVNYMSFLVDPEQPVHFFKYNITAVCTPNPKMVEEYLSITTEEKSSIFVPDNKIIL